MRPLLLALFFVSGAVGLAYELLLARLLLLRIGSTAASSGLVLGLFVAGLGLGARWAGPRAVRHLRPLRLYAWAEAGAALWALGALWLLTQGRLGFAAGLGGPLLAAVTVLPTAYFLGWSLPAGVAAWVRAGTRSDPRAGARGVAWLYGINALGAVLGCLATGWYAIGHLGLPWAGALAVGAGLLLAAIAWAVPGHPSGAGAEPVAVTPRPSDAPEGGVRLPAAFAWALAFGALGLAIEVVGFRILVFFVEGFTISFASMLAVFIGGLSLGSLLLGPPLLRLRDPERVLGCLACLVGVVLLVEGLVVVPRLEGWSEALRAGLLREAVDAGAIPGATRWASLGSAACLLFVPALLLGPTFSLAVACYEARGRAPADAVGATYLGNALGSLLGPTAVTFALLPAKGVWAGAVGLTACVLVLGVMLLRRSTRRWALAASALALLGICFALSGDAWTRAFLGHTHILRAKEGGIVATRHIEAVATDALTTASVIRTPRGERVLYTDDFAAASTGRSYHYMRMLGTLPVLLARQAEHAMVIAFGTGTTAGAVAASPHVKRLEIVEVSSAVLELAPWFREVHRGVLDDPRTTLLRADGRHALLGHSADLDVITLEPLMPYSPQGLPLYTQELYELARDRVREGGVVCQWVPIHGMPASLYAAFVRTFFHVFPEGSLWFFEETSALIARKGDGPTPEAFQARWAGLEADLQGAGLVSTDALAAAFVASGSEVLAAPAPPGEGLLDPHLIVSDLHPFPELLATPRAGLHTTYLADTLAYLATLVQDKPIPAGAVFTRPDKSLRPATRAALAARYGHAQAEALGVHLARTADAAKRATLAASRAEALERSAEAFRHARSAVPKDPILRTRHVRVLRELALLRAGEAQARAKQGDARAARLALRLLAAALPPALMDEDPEGSARPSVLHAYVRALVAQGRATSALAALPEAHALRAPLRAWRQGVEGGGAELGRALGGMQVPEPLQDELVVVDAQRARLLRRGPGHARAAAAFVRAVRDRVLGHVALAWLRDQEGSAQRLSEGTRRALEAALGGMALPWDEVWATWKPRDVVDAIALHARTPGAKADALVPGFTAEEGTVREATVRAAGTLGAHLDRVLSRLNDDVLAVRQSAVGVLVHAWGEDALTGYAPTLSAKRRAAFIESLRARRAQDSR